MDSRVAGAPFLWASAPASRRTRQASFAAFAATLAILSAPLFFGWSYFGTDITLFDLGKTCEIQARLAAHESLLISPDLGNGEPLAADPQSQLLYPLRWLSILLPRAIGVSFVQILHLALAAAAAAWLARTFRLQRFSAACAGIIFALAGTELNLIKHSTYVVGAVVLPLTWAVGRRILQRHLGLHLPLLLFVSMAMGLLGAEPQSVAIGLVILGIECLFRWREARRSHLIRLALPVAAGLILGLSAWAGTLAELAITARAHGTTTSQVGIWSFEPVLWLGAIWPGTVVERLRSDANLWSLTHGHEFPDAWNLTPYLGCLFLASLLSSIGRRRFRVVAAVFLISLVVSMGDVVPPVAFLLRHLPLFHSFRYAEKYLPTMMLAGSLLCAAALERGPLRPRARRRLLTVWGLTLAVQMVCIATISLSSSHLDLFTPETGGEGPSLSKMLIGAISQGCAPLVLGIGILGSQWTRAHRALALLVIADLLVAAPGAIDIGPRLDDIESPLTALRRADQARPPIICLDPKINPSIKVGATTASWLGVFNMRVLAYPDLNACDGLSNGISYSVLQSSFGEQLELGVSAGAPSATRALGCTHLISQHLPQGRSWQRVALHGLEDVIPFARGGVGVFQLDDPLPSSFAVPDAVLATREGDAIEAVAAAPTSVAALRTVDDPSGKLGAGYSLPVAGTVEGVSTERRGTTDIEVTARGHGGAVVGMLTSFRVGWTALQAGRELPMVRVAGSHLGAIVEDIGRGPIEFRYALPNFRWSVFLGMLGIALLAASLAYERRFRTTALLDGRANL